MQIGILVNTLDTRAPGHTTFGIALEAVKRGHQVWITSPGHLSFDTDDHVHAFARSVPPGRYSFEKLLHTLLGKHALQRNINVDELDVLLIRNNPVAQRPWAQSAGVEFARLAMRRGVVVLSDPNGLSKAANKLYLNTYPERIRPRTLVTRSTERITKMLDAEGTIILKPLEGYGGKGHRKAGKG